MTDSGRWKSDAGVWRAEAINRITEDGYQSSVVGYRFSCHSVFKVALGCHCEEPATKQSQWV